MTRRIILLALVVLASALGAGAALAHGNGTAVSGAAAAPSCSTSASPKLPDGSALHLSGVWHEPAQADLVGGTAYIRQIGDCYWLLLMSADGGRQFTSVAHGTIGPGLVIVGTWADSPRMTTEMGHGTFRHKIIVGAGGKITIGAGGITYAPLTLKKACLWATRC